MIRVVVDPGVFISARPKFSRYADAGTRREFVERIRRHATVVVDPADLPVATRDRKDDYLVALARSERVDALVSGDRDLLDAGLDATGVESAPTVRADRQSLTPAGAQGRITAARAPRIVAVGSRRSPRANSRKRWE